MAWKKILLDGDAAVLSSTPPVNANFAAADDGSATEASRQDHKHDLDEGTTGDLQPVDGTAEAIGTANGVAHVDHIHALGPLVASLNYAQNQATFLVLHKSATAPSSGTEVEGQVYYDTTGGDQHPYLWVP